MCRRVVKTACRKRRTRKKNYESLNCLLADDVSETLPCRSNTPSSGSASSSFVGILLEELTENKNVGSYNNVYDKINFIFSTDFNFFPIRTWVHTM